MHLVHDSRIDQDVRFVSNFASKPLEVEFRNNYKINELKLNNESTSGVAVAIMLNQPLWFQRRYTFIVQNVLNNIPKNWKVDFYNIVR